MKRKDFFEKFGDFISQFDSLKSYLPTINSHGYPFIIIFIIATFFLSLLSDFLGWLGFVINNMVCIFFSEIRRELSQIKKIF